MSDDTVPGALIAIGSAVFFISKTDLEAYRLPNAAATEALTAMAGGEKTRAMTASGEGVGEPLVALAKYTPPVPSYGTTWQFPLTLSRMCW
ncbi:MAG: hypothetical protein AAF637_07275 [Pseudomonadota bacterium]